MPGIQMSGPAGHIQVSRNLLLQSTLMIQPLFGQTFRLTYLRFALLLNSPKVRSRAATSQRVNQSDYRRRVAHIATVNGEFAVRRVVSDVTEAHRHVQRQARR